MIIRIINGPNLNRLGIREPHIYGSKTYRELEAYLHACAAQLGVHVEVLQSNSEGQIVDWIHEDDCYDALIINPGAYSHTSIAIMDALLSLDCSVIEVHLSNVHSREPFRKQLYSGSAVQGIVSGLGFFGYNCALQYLTQEV